MRTYFSMQIDNSYRLCICFFSHCENYVMTSISVLVRSCHLFCVLSYRDCRFICIPGQSATSCYNRPTWIAFTLPGKNILMKACSAGFFSFPHQLFGYADFYTAAELSFTSLIFSLLRFVAVSQVLVMDTSIYIVNHLVLMNNTF